MRLQTQSPANDVQLVDALVADLAVAVILEKPPAADGQLVVGFHGGRPHPEVPVHTLGHGLGRAATAGADLVGDAPCHVDPADGPGLELLDPFADLGTGAALGAVLHDPLVLAGGLDHLAALEDVVRGGLFHVDVLAGLAGPDRFQGVPVVGRGQRHGVDRLVIEQLAVIRKQGGGPAGLILDLLGRHAQTPFVAVAERGNLHVLLVHLQQGSAVRLAAPPAKPGHAYANPLARAGRRTRYRWQGEGGRAAEERRGFQKITTGRSRHSRLRKLWLRVVVVLASRVRSATLRPAAGWPEYVPGWAIGLSSPASIDVPPRSEPWNILPSIPSSGMVRTDFSRLLLH